MMIKRLLEVVFSSAFRGLMCVRSMVLIVALSISVTIDAMDGQTQGPVYGAGQFDCKTWTDSQSDVHQWTRYGEWIAGYVTSATVQKGLSLTNNQSIFFFISSYCKAHPQDTMAVASQHFVETLQPNHGH
jgi:hypothetical protein